LLEAEPLLREALGPRHPHTLTAMHTLAVLYKDQGRYGEAEPLYRETLRLNREALGPRHSYTLAFMINLAVLYKEQGRYGEAEPLLLEAEPLLREALGPRHPHTLIAMNTLAGLYWSQGRPGEAEPFLREAMRLSQEALGPRHPDTLRYQLYGALNLVALGRIGEAGRQLRAMEPQLLDWLGAELYSNEAAGVRNHLVASQDTYQHAAFSLALLPGAGTAEAEGAASVVLRLKGLQAEEEAYLARIVRRGEDPHARQLAAEIAALRSRLAALFHAGGQPDEIATPYRWLEAQEPALDRGGAEEAYLARIIPRGEDPHARELAAEIAALTRRLEAQELALGRVSRAYAQHLQVRDVSLADLQATLPPGHALLEMRAYRPLDFRTDDPGPWRWAGLLSRGDAVRVRDLGPAEGSAAQAQALLDDPEGEAGQDAATALHAQLLAPFAAELAGLERLYLAPDGTLNLVPFAALRGPDGRRLAEALDVRLVQTGRDLLRPAADRSARGLLALGGIDFDAAEVRLAVPPATEPVLLGVSAAEVASRTAAALAGGFVPLPGTAEEVWAIAAQYRRARGEEAVEVWEGAEASEARLRALAQPPRVLHLATHGFYRSAGTLQDRPLLLAGVALAGANPALREAGWDGILHAIEAQDLDLEGTELVVLSACETALGQIDYGEGVSGLVRALRTAGARNVLVTLRAVSDQGASAFMQLFYRHWLSQAEGSDPAAAFRAAQREGLTVAKGTGADPTWVQFVLVGK
jgi:CHAT domain-containing protein